MSLKKLFSKIFSKDNASTKKPESKNDSINLSEEEFVNSVEVQNIFEKYGKETILLRPHKAKTEHSTKESKMGGMPNLLNFKSYPKCDSCGNFLNFVIQIYKKDFSDFYFPEDKDLFQLFRCPNFNCPSAFSKTSDLKVFPYFFKDSKKENNLKKEKLITGKDVEKEIPECEFKIQKLKDFPNYDDFSGDELSQIGKKFGDEWEDYFIDNYSAKTGTKYKGYPSWTQSPNRPICKCGKEKEFFFQLSSEDIEDGVPYPPSPDKWSAHGIMIGDVGNIYFFVCKDCGEKSIETNWDCS